MCIEIQSGVTSLQSLVSTVILTGGLSLYSADSLSLCVTDEIGDLSSVRRSFTTA